MEWISVEDRLPREEQRVLVTSYVRRFRGQYVNLAVFRTDPRMGECFVYANAYHPKECWGRKRSVTHWMPLPEPPEE